MFSDPPQASTQDSLVDWLQSPPGRSLFEAEAVAVKSALDSVFGDEFLQIGAWGADVYAGYARTQRQAAVADSLAPGVRIVCRLDDLAIASDSIDVVVMSHSLETSDNPHALLREVDRILRPGGHVISLGFNPRGLWGVRHYLTRKHYPPGVQRLIAEVRLRDWLSLLNFGVLDSNKYHFQLPLNSASSRDSDRADGTPEDSQATEPSVWQSTWHRMQSWPPFAACYLLVARKEVYTVTPLRPVARRPTRLVGSLVNPTTRNAA